MVGLPCSGKTTQAKILEKEYNALLLTTDKWHVKLFGNDVIWETHDKIHGIIEKIIWEVAERVLFLGNDVIIDFGFWGREERKYWKNKAKEIGVNFKMYVMDVSDEELLKRLEIRNKNPGDSFIIPKEKMLEYIKMFQPVDQDEIDELQGTNNKNNCKKCDAVKVEVIKCQAPNLHSVVTPHGTPPIA